MRDADISAADLERYEMDCGIAASIRSAKPVMRTADPCDANMTYVVLSERLFREKYTGPVTLHFAQGQPVRAEIPSAPTRIRLEKS